MTAETLNPTGGEGRYPLTPMQAGMLFNSLRAPGSGVDLMQRVIELDEELDQHAFEAAWQSVLERHAVLRIALCWQDLETPHQQVHRAVRLPLEWLDWSAHDADQKAERWQQLMRADRRRGIDLATAPLMRITAVRLSLTSYRLLWSVHHALMDGPALILVLAEVLRCYRAEEPASAPEAPATFFDYVAWCQERGQTRRAAASEDFWRRSLAPLEELTRLSCEPGRDDLALEHRTYELRLSTELSARLRGFADAHELTENIVVQGAWALVSSRWSRQRTVSFGAVKTCRKSSVPGAERSVGLFLNTLPLVVEVDPDAGAVEWLTQLRSAWVAMREHEHTPLAEIQRLAPTRGALFESITCYDPLDYDAALAAELSEHDAARCRIEVHDQTNFPLELHAFGGPELLLRLTYSTRRFSEATIERLADSVQQALLGLIEAGAEPLKTIGLVSPADAHQLALWAGHPTPFPGDRRVDELFAEQAARTPEALAVQYAAEALTYAELDQRAERLAQHLRAMQLAPEECVGLGLKPSVDLIVGMLGVLKAGGAYVPLDPSYPSARTAHLVEQVGARVVVTSQALEPRFAGLEVARICLDVPAALWPSELRRSAQVAPNPASSNAGKALAYVLFTSGSTGTPKGVCIPHAGIVRLVRDTDYVQVKASDRIGQVANPSFDAVTFEIWGALLSGAAVVGVSREVLIDPDRLRAQIRADGLSMFFMTSSLFNQLSLQRADVFEDVRVLFFGGEVADPERVRAVLGASRPERLINIYGPTENTAYSTWHEVFDVPALARTVPIGRPVANTTVYVLDEYGHPVPIGAPGELCLGGEGLMLGYLGEPELTASRLRPDLLGARGTLFHTRDLVRFNARGQLEFIERMDAQVKVRGHRIEPGEIEACVRKSAGVDEVLVMVREDTPGDKRVVAYVVPGVESLLAEVKERLSAELPDHLVPSAFVGLSSLPLNANGKVDRNQLAAPTERATTREFVAPQSAVEIGIAALWCELLAVKRVGLHDDFFELGGHSLLAMRVVNRMRETLGVELNLDDFFQKPNVAELAALPAFAQPGPPSSPSSSGPPIPNGELSGPEPAGGDIEPPLSFAQERLWFLQQLDPGQTSYHIQSLVRIGGQLDERRLRAACQQLCARHAILRSRVEVDAAGVPRQFARPESDAGELVFEHSDLTGIDALEREVAARAQIESFVLRPFDLRRDAPLRFVLLRLSSVDHALGCVLHHSAADGWSLAILNRELAALYAGESLPKLAMQYGDFARWQRRDALERGFEAELSYWRKQLADAATLELPLRAQRPAVQSLAAGRLRTSFPRALLDRVEVFAQQQQSTLFVVLATAFDLLLRRTSGQLDVVIGFPVAARESVECEQLIGCFVNTLVLRTDLSGDPSLRELVARVQLAVRGALLHQRLPFERLVEELEPDRDRSRNPIFQVLFALQNTPRDPLSLTGLDVQNFDAEVPITRLDLEWHLRETSAGLELEANFAKQLFSDAAIERMSAHFGSLLAELAAANSAARPISELELLTAGELAQARAWNDTEVEFGPPRCVHELVFAQAERTPRGIAIACGGRELSYAELVRRARELSARLKLRGVAPGELVGLCVERSPQQGTDLLVGLLGILAAGAAYVPLDPELPQERLALMLGDSGANALVTHSSLLERLPLCGSFDAARRVLLDVVDDPAPVASGADHVAPVEVGEAGDAEALAYVIYTSGSTGRPKGVEVTHASVFNFLQAMLREPGLTPDDVLLAVTTISFDIAGLELFLPLCVGARIELATRAEATDGARLAALLAERSVSVMQATPATWQMLVDAGWAGGAGPRDLKMLCGGEALPVGLARELLQHGGQLWNLYGPTEATIWTALQRVETSDLEGASVALGHPLANTQLWVLDEQHNQVPQGTIGELYIEGLGLARGYRGREELTAEVFLAGRRPELRGARLYRTGDLVRFDEQHRLRFVGRRDHQVKLRGHRIELGEIEAVIASYEGVTQAVVLISGEAPDQRLVAYLVPAELARPKECAGLREFLSQRLPAVMLPSLFVGLDALPLTPSGKLDRKALQALETAPERMEAGRELAGSATPKNPIEAGLLAAFAELLDVQGIGVHENFFDLGGHSLSATRLVSRIRAIFQVELPLSQVFETPTVAELGHSVQALRGAAAIGRAPLVPLAQLAQLPAGESAAKDASFEPSFAQTRLWFLDKLGTGGAYHMRLTLEIQGPLERSVLEQSLAAILARHSVLRSRFVESGGSPRVRIDPSCEVPLLLHGAGQVLREVVAAEAERPFDLARGPLVRAELVPLGIDSHALILGFHHIVADGWSFGILTREIADLYRAFSRQQPVTLKPLPVQYTDYAAWQRRGLSDEVLERELSAWKARLGSDLPVLQLPTDRPRPEVQSFAGAAVRFQIDADQTAALRALSRERGATLSMLLCAAYQVLLARESGQPEIVVGSPIAGRTRAETEDLIGLFVNSIVLRVDLSDDPSFAELLARVQQASLFAYDHQDLPFERLVDELAPARDPSRSPLFQAVFAMQGAPPLEFEVDQLKWRVLPDEVTSTRHDLELFMFELPSALDASRGALEGCLVYPVKLFDAARIERLAGHFQTLLAAVLADPERRVSTLPLLAPGEDRELFEWALGPQRSGVEATQVADMAGAAGAFDSLPLHEAVASHAALRPAACALVFHDTQLSYAELNERANQLAHRLLALNVEPGALVGLCLERSPEMVVALLGILKAGAAYLPLDPTYPRERIAFMLADSDLQLVVTHSNQLDVLQEATAAGRELSTLCLDRDLEALSKALASNPTRRAEPDDLAYAIYTSGSTGRPKAALLEHRGLCNLAREQRLCFGLDAESRVLQFASLSFDAATFEIVMALSHGATLVLGDKQELLPGPDLAGFLARQRVSVVTLPPTALTALSDDDAARLSELRTITVAGEACPAELVRRWSAHARFFNLYGPTEATIWSTMVELRPDQDVHIGKPIGGVQVYVLDSAQRPVPVGVAGELWIGGVGLAREYLGRPELTRERFQELLLDGQGLRLYRSGDLVRWRRDGALDFLGRIDDQVKLRGHRIELGELESRLDQHTAVLQSVALVREDTPGERRLVAYVVPVAEVETLLDKSVRSGDHVGAWQDLYEEAYASSGEGAGDDMAANAADDGAPFDIASWESSYTQAPIPAKEMRVWVTETVAAIARSRPHSILEIGCGSGLLLFRLAPDCSEYLGLDFSQAALDGVAAHVAALGLGDRVRLEQRRADELQGLPSGHFDTIVLNSVAQYFPSAEYLAGVLEEALGLLKPGGTLFVGDVRSLPLFEAFHTSVQRFRAGPRVDAASLERSAKQALNQDQELVVDPGFFQALRERVPRVSWVSIEPKRGAYDNELSRYRYDVRMTLGGDDAPLGSTEEPLVSARKLTRSDWAGELGALSDLAALLTGAQTELVLVTGIPNRRVAETPEGSDTPDGPGALSAPDPNQLRALGREHGFGCALGWFSARSDGAVDALFERVAPEVGLTASEVEPSPEAWNRLAFETSPKPRSASSSWGDYANQPLRARLLRELVPRLREHLAAGLPGYMVPQSFVVLDALPLTPNGKVDRRALPLPDALRPELKSDYAAPRGEAQVALSRIWAATLDLERVGVHDNFFELGGDSILSIQLVSAARKAGFAFTAKDLFLHQSVAELLEHTLVDPAPAKALAIEQGLVLGAVAATPIQRWFYARALRTAAHFHQALLLESASTLELELVRTALAALCVHHDALRQRPAPPDEVFFESPQKTPPELVLHDLSELSPDACAREVERIGSELQAGYSWAAGTCLRAALLRTAADAPDLLLLVVHHLAIDAVSWRFLLEDLERALDQLALGEAVVLAPKTSSVRDWSKALSDYARTPELARAADWWSDQSWPDTRVLFPTASTEGDGPAASIGHEIVFDAGETAVFLRELPGRLDLQPHELLIALSARALASSAQRSVIAFALEGHGREELFDNIDLSRTVGWFTSLYPVPLAAHLELSVRHALQRVRDRLRSIPARGLPFGVARYLAGDQRLAAVPEPEVSFNFLGRLDATLGTSAQWRRSEFSIGASQSSRDARAHRLEIAASIQADQLRMTWTADADEATTRLVERALATFGAELRGLLEPPSAAAQAVGMGDFDWSSEDVADILDELEDG